jgi:T4-like virus Myoviridae tail sheath stabiliser
MFGQIFNNNSIRNYIIYFGNLFSNLILIRDNDAGTEIQRMVVPLQYGPKEKFLSRLEGNPDLEREIAISLPRMSFEIIGLTYDPSRKLNSTGRIISSDGIDPNKKNYQYNPVPYNIDINLYIMTKNIEDGTKIVEQILPYFTPEYTGSIIVNNDLNNKYDVPLILNQVHNVDTYEGSYLERRAIIWVLSFQLKANMFGPTKSSNIIKQVEVKFISSDGNNLCDPQAEYEKVIITPGLTATGQPTDSHTNSINKNLIKSTDNFGYIEDFINSVDL